jgi:basic amino acid/polyamine antiporter, APA family
MADLWAKKQMALLLAKAEESDVQAPSTHGGVPLRRRLSAASLIVLGVGDIIEAGIIVLTGHAAAANARPAKTCRRLRSR